MDRAYGNHSGHAESYDRRAGRKSSAIGAAAGRALERHRSTAFERADQYSVGSARSRAGRAPLGRCEIAAICFVADPIRRPELELGSERIEFRAVARTLFPRVFAIGAVSHVRSGCRAFRGHLEIGGKDDRPAARPPGRHRRGMFRKRALPRHGHFRFGASRRAELLSRTSAQRTLDPRAQMVLRRQCARSARTIGASLSATANCRNGSRSSLQLTRRANRPAGVDCCSRLRCSSICRSSKRFGRLLRHPVSVRSAAVHRLAAHLAAA